MSKNKKTGNEENILLLGLLLTTNATTNANIQIYINGTQLNRAVYHFNLTTYTIYLTSAVQISRKYTTYSYSFCDIRQLENFRFRHCERHAWLLNVLPRAIFRAFVGHWSRVTVRNKKTKRFRINA